jgi:hypothetical protein
MAVREYSIQERDGLLKDLRKAFEEYYKNSGKKHFSLNKSKQELKSDFFRQLDDDSKKGNVEKGYTIARSVLESFFKDQTKKSFNDKTPVKINALINFYNEHVYDSEKNEPRAKEDSTINSARAFDFEESVKAIDEEYRIDSFWNLKDGSFLNRYRTIIAYFFSVVILPLLFIFILFFINENNTVFFSFVLLIVWVISTIATIKGILITRKSAVKGNISNIRYLIFTIGALMSILYLVYLYIGSKYIIGELYGKPPEIYYDSAFVIDPTGLGYGNTTINFNFDGANDTDELDVNFLRNSDSKSFYVFIDYQNATDVTLHDAKARISFTEEGISRSTKITGTLISSVGGTVIDQTKLINLPEKWELKIIKAFAINSHSQIECPNYAYEIGLDVNALTDNYGASLPALGTEGLSLLNGYKGACSQGHVVVKFQLFKL